MSAPDRHVRIAPESRKRLVIPALLGVALVCFVAWFFVTGSGLRGVAGDSDSTVSSEGQPDRQPLAVSELPEVAPASSREEQAALGFDRQDASTCPVHVRVTYSDGTPVEGATIRLRLPAEGTRIHRILVPDAEERYGVSIDEQWAVQTLAEVNKAAGVDGLFRTSAEGEAWFLVPASVPYAFVAVEPVVGQASAEQWVHADPGEGTQEFECSVALPGSLTVTARDAFGAPILLDEVRVTPLQEDGTEHDIYRPDAGYWPGWVEMGKPEEGSEGTSRDSRVDLDELPLESLCVWARSGSAGAYQVVHLSRTQPHADVTLRMPATGQLSGRVRTGSGLPVRGRVITCQSESSQHWSNAVTDGEGWFAAETLQGETYTVMVPTSPSPTFPHMGAAHRMSVGPREFPPDEGSPMIPWTQVRSNARDLDLRIPDGGRLRFRALVGNASVRVVAYLIQQDGPGVREITYTGLLTELWPIPPGRYTWVLMGMGFNSTSIAVGTTTIEEQLVDLGTVPLQQAALLSLKMAPGETVTWMRIHRNQQLLWEGDPALLPAARPGVLRLPPGTYHLEWRRGSQGPLQQRALDLVGGEDVALEGAHP